MLDADGNRFVDLTSGFGVALVGHRHPDVVAAARAQADRLVHAMGDAWPDETRIALLAELAELCPGDLSVSILGLSGSDSVDGALKTAMLATGRPGVITFDGGYHGLMLGVLPLQGYRRAFADPFRPALNPHVRSLPWACPRAALDEALADGEVGLVLVEPIQGRGGVRPAPEGWLEELIEAAHRAGALVAFDEIQTGCGRTGSAFRAEALRALPDLLIAGKALAGGFPLSAVVGTPEAMSGWRASQGEALHTQTFLGHPVGCAAAGAVLALLRDGLADRVAAAGAALVTDLGAAGFRVRGAGLMVGVHVPEPLAVTRALLQRGFVTLPAGATDPVLCLTPPVCLTDEQRGAFVDALIEVTGG